MTQSKELETEIRKLKLELIKQELNDKIITFRAYMEKKQQSILQNDTRNLNNQSTNSNSTDEISSEKPFSSVLFVPIIGTYIYLAFLLHSIFTLDLAYFFKIQLIIQKNKIILGDFEVWHFVVLTFIVWIFLSKLYFFFSL